MDLRGFDGEAGLHPEVNGLTECGAGSTRSAGGG